MNRIAVVLTLLILIILSPAMGQLITHQDFRNSELASKYQYFKYLEDKNRQGFLLDQSDYDVKHYRLDLDFTDVANEIITGTVTTTSEIMTDGVVEIDYDLKNAMNVSSVVANGQIVEFSHLHDMIHISLDTVYNTGDFITTVIDYSGHPADDQRSFVWDWHFDQPMISTHSFTHGTSEWWPCKDVVSDKADSADIFITVAINLTATSNGLMISNTDNGDGTRTFHWHSYYPITAYLIAVAVCDYVNFTDWYVTADGDSMPIVNYVYAEHLDNAIEDLNVTAGAIESFAGIFGEYPFIDEKYGHSIWTWGGAMEHQCNTFYSDVGITGNHWYDWVVVHEAAHMWFGDMITCDDWPDIWLNEGFASFLEMLWIEEMYGPDSMMVYQNYYNNVQYPSGPIYDPDPLLDGNTVYNKGSWVLHMLRGVMGDEAFFGGFYAYANDPRFMHGTATTRQFQSVMEQYYNDDLAWFFDQWVWGVNRPFYIYSWLAEDIGEGQHEVFLHIEQSQDPPSPEVFAMPIRVYPILTNQDTLEIAVFNDSRIDDIRFTIEGQPLQIGFDIDDWILKYAYREGYRLNIVTTGLPAGTAGEYYEALIEARGGEEPYTFTVIDGELPEGLSLAESTGILSGTPSVGGIYAFTVECSDSYSNPRTDEQDYSLLIEPYTGVDDDESLIPDKILLLGNFPNPFNSSTNISFHLASSSIVSLETFNVLGQRIETIIEGRLSAGYHSIIWNAGQNPSGIYLYKLTAGSETAFGKMAYMK